MKRFYCLLAVCLCVLLAAGVATAEAKKLKAGFVYVGPVGDYGWSHAHDVGRKYAMEKLPWLESVFIESVPEADSARIIDRLVQEQKCDVVFTTSFGYMDDTITTILAVLMIKIVSFLAIIGVCTVAVKKVWDGN